MTDKKTEIAPKCFNNIQDAFGTTNRGEIIPCCWLDTQSTRRDPDYQKLLEVSRIDDYDSIDEIFLTDEWIDFFNNLKKGIGFPVCYKICKKREQGQHKKESIYNPKTGKKIREHST